MGPKKKSLKVSYLADDMTDKELLKVFTKYGAVGAVISMDKHGVSKCCGFVEFPDAQTAKQVFNKLKDKPIDGRRLHLTIPKFEINGRWQRPKNYLSNKKHPSKKKKKKQKKKKKGGTGKVTDLFKGLKALKEKNASKKAQRGKKTIQIKETNQKGMKGKKSKIEKAIKGKRKK